SDFTHFTSYVSLVKNKECAYNFGIRDSISQLHYLCMKCKGDGTINISIKNENGKTMLPKTNCKTTNWKWIKISIPEKNISSGNNTITFQDAKGTVDIDKFVITTNEKLNPDK
ncbi:MAG TPA: hypothetical protein VNG53_07975, partial [Bacteroidia bacterium]|nr:hypothetical protein [Bacteroidia bacterium]